VSHKAPGPNFVSSNKDDFIYLFILFILFLSMAPPMTVFASIPIYTKDLIQVDSSNGMRYLQNRIIHEN